MAEVTRRDKAPRRRTPARRRRNYMAQCDALCGKIVRARGRCENPTCREQRGALQWAHGFSRRYLPIRHDLRNGFCLCAGCHRWYTLHPLEWEEWLLEKWGRRLFNALRKRALDGGRVDWPARLAELRDLAERAGVTA